MIWTLMLTIAGGVALGIVGVVAVPAAICVVVYATIAAVKGAWRALFHPESWATAVVAWSAAIALLLYLSAV